MDELEQYIKDNELSQENILNLVDDYDVYCEYIGIDLEIGVKYSSPLREGDDDPSFVLFKSNRDDKILFKDHATGDTGNVFNFLSLYLDLPKRLVYKQINHDLGLGLDGKESGETEGEFKPVVKKRIKVIREALTIKVTRKRKISKTFKEYWSTLDIDMPMAARYHAYDVEVLHFITESEHKRVYPKSLCIAYGIAGYFKVYQPLGERAFKFRNNYPYKFVEGAVQLTFEHDFCIITKSTKECMFFRQHFGWDAVASTSENTMISDYFFEHTLSKYKKVFIWLDIDAPGIRAQEKYLEKYPHLIPIVHSRYPEYKDPTDIYVDAKKEGWTEECLLYIRSLIMEEVDGKRKRA
jgi:hypothetical protein